MDNFTKILSPDIKTDTGSSPHSKQAKARTFSGSSGEN